MLLLVLMLRYYLFVLNCWFSDVFNRLFHRLGFFCYMLLVTRWLFFRKHLGFCFLKVFVYFFIFEVVKEGAE